jgi:hypothetical protein
LSFVSQPASRLSSSFSSENVQVAVEEENKQREELMTMEEKYKEKNLKNVAGDANSNQNEESGTVGILKRVGGFQGCIRNLVINDRVYRFGLEPAGDSLQGFDIGKSKVKKKFEKEKKMGEIKK